MKYRIPESILSKDPGLDHLGDGKVAVCLLEDEVDPEKQQRRKEHLLELLQNAGMGPLQLQEVEAAMDGKRQVNKKVRAGQNQYVHAHVVP